MLVYKTIKLAASSERLSFLQNVDRHLTGEEPSSENFDSNADRLESVELYKS